MLPTTTIPSLPPQARAAEPTASGVADDQESDAFADALQRAQARPKHAHASDARGGPKTTEPHGRHAVRERAAAQDGASQPANDPASLDGKIMPTAGEDVTSNGNRSGETPGVDGSVPVGPPALTIDTTPVAQPTTDPRRAIAACDTDVDDAAQAVDARAAVTRPAARTAAHDWRAGAATPDQLPAPGNATDTRAGAATPLPLRAALERATDEATPATATRAPSFERLPVEPPVAFVAAASLRETSGPGAAASTEHALPHANIGAAIDEPGFGTALGSQVALWVRDGVQEARLQLHPAELGPVTVQIALDGQAAHVDFTAAVAATRESIEQSLPALAAALRESGFTLAGGGVSGQAGQSGGDTRRDRTLTGSGNRSRSDGGVDAGPGAAVPRRWTRSLLDVYA